ncbi:MAG: methyltransferase domain-containing protein [Alphaproteobacteria bacterium]|nr:methyltransferase domain-containing protein [Alphaproteobacteria bacterium]
MPEAPDERNPIEKRNALLREKGMNYALTRKAWLVMSHMLLDEGARVVDMGCGEGALTFIMAALHPKIHFIGLDKNRRAITKATQTYELPNLEFRVGDISAQIFDENSLDGIINAFVLHEIYSASRYSDRIVTETLETHFRMLKNGGMMFLQDYARPPPEEYVLLEMADKKSRGKALAELSEADLLVWYSEHARPRSDPGFAGFFMEELPPRLPKKRLFRLPHKWAYEFLMRKDDRALWEKELPIEYTFFTPRELRQVLGSFGSRVQYAAPHWDEDFIAEKIEGKITIFSDSGEMLGPPPTSFLSVAVKLPERQSLRIEERRPSPGDSESSLHIAALRNEKTGSIVEVVRRHELFHEVIPYRVDEEDRLKITLHEGVARSIGNAVPRSGINIDGRHWSGHMVEPVAVSARFIDEMGAPDPKNTVLFARNCLGLKPQDGALLTHGPDYYPAPDYIDEQVQTYFLAIRKAGKASAPKSLIDTTGRFQAKGMIREFDAQQILNAITVGMIPNSRLELQILSLFEYLKIKPENWSDQRLNVEAGKITGDLKLREFLNQMANSDKRFKDIKGSSGQLRPVHSTFVEEGRTKGTIAGISAQDVDFVVQNDKTINTAVVLPITKSMKNDVHAGFQMTHLPVPQRYEGTSSTIAAPSFNLPPDITDTKSAKKYIAEKFGVLPHMVLKMGESYYTHIGVTPQKIHPFVIVAPPDFFKDPNTNFLPLFQLMMIMDKLKKDQNFMTVMARSFRAFHEELKFDLVRRVSPIVKAQFEQVKPAWGLPMAYEPAPFSRPARSEPTASAPRITVQPAVSSSPVAPEIKSSAPSSTRIAVPEKTKKQDAAPPVPKPEKRLSESFENHLEEIADALESLNAPRPGA